MQLKHMRKEIAQFLQAGQEAIARIRVEHVIREQNLWAAYEILELFCEFVLARVPVLESKKECPFELREAIASIIFAAPRCSEVPDLLQIKSLFAAKYGKEFVMAASELRPDSGVNRAIIENLSVNVPSAEARLKVLKEIAQEYNLAWDPSGTEAELSKKHEDLLGGSKQIVAQAGHSEAPMDKKSHKTPSNGVIPNTVSFSNQGSQYPQTPTPTSNLKNEASVKNQSAGPVADNERGAASPSSDVLERAQAAIASAERATAAARAAAELVKANYGSLKLEEKSS